MHKELLLFNEGRSLPVTIRNYGMEDTEQMIDIQRRSFPPPFPEELWWKPEQLQEHVSRFPEGALCAEVDGVLIGSMTGLLVSDRALEGSHAWAAITDNGYIRTHDPAGKTLYVVDICVDPGYRGAGIGHWLMQSLYETTVHLGLDRLLGGGRMPGYHKYAGEMSAEQYLEQVKTGKLRDPVISFLLRCGRLPVGVAADYLEDEESCNYAALMEWRNPFKHAT
ncbi:GNAT family N-acetyltransferase [Paenibacillus sp. 1P07SE]|uniref:GNAT family N-acetyltransferase n=1 Tax=Paenibacillus sp. 1P07SE TaxID=3132209 RepID=UPI0039A5A6C4